MSYCDEAGEDARKRGPYADFVEGLYIAPSDRIQWRDVEDAVVSTLLADPSTATMEAFSLRQPTDILAEALRRHASPATIRALMSLTDRKNP